MKKFFSTLILAACACFSSLAQQPTSATVTAGTFTCAAQSATNVGYIIDCTKARYVGLQLVTTNDASGTAANGTTAVCTLTNLDSIGGAYIKINWVTNAAATANCSFGQIKYRLKISAP